MRWEHQSVEEEERQRLPGYRESAVVRRFRAPEAVDTRFYEVNAKSVLNRVPAASRMPFRWTVNPYRGCTHACAYCVSGDTRVTLADGRHRAIAELDVGDEIYGTVRRGRYRRYTRTTVLDRWTSVKPAYRVTLEDGTELVASGDHLFLTDRGWKHVANSSRGDPDRSHLTTRNSLVGTGGVAPGRANGDVHAFRLALTDYEGLERTRGYLGGEGVTTRERVFARATERHREVTAIITGRRASVQRIAELTEWPLMPSLDWCRGFLAGMFDAEGSRSAFALRIANADAQILAWIDACARRLGFDVAHDRTHDDDGLAYIRIRGGLSEHLRFFHLTDPAITRRRSIEGEMVKTFANLRIVSIEALGIQLPLYDITTGTGDFIANGVVSHNCFARPTHTYLGFDAGRDFEREIVVKVNAPERLRVELGRPSWTGEHVALGTNTDPYQWVEGRYRLMPGIWEALRDARNPCSILTKSPLLARDLKLMREIADRAEFSAAVSVPTVDEKAWRATEPHSPNPRARLEALAELSRAGIRTGVLIAPLMPGINDAPEQVERILELAAEAGASYIVGIALHLRADVRGVFFAWLAEHRPDLVTRYEDLYRSGAYLPPAERRRLERLAEDPDRPPSMRLRPEADRVKRGGRSELVRAAVAGELKGVMAQARLF